MAEQKIESDVSGSVSRIECADADVLTEGDTLLIIESMKMEIPVTAPAGLKVVRLLVAVGDAVSEGQALAIVDMAA